MGRWRTKKTAGDFDTWRAECHQRYVRQYGAELAGLWLDLVDGHTAAFGHELDWRGFHECVTIAKAEVMLCG